MFRRLFMVTFGILCLGTMFGLGPKALALAKELTFVTPLLMNEGADAERGATSQQDGVEVLARGPIHEAFAKPTVRGPASSEIVPKEPPKLIDELAPDQKPDGDNVQWIPGYWAWDDTTADFLWVSGTYRTVPPGRHWVPGYWNQTPEGWQRVAGFWGDQANEHIDLLPAPPDPIDEAVTAAPTEDSIFQPGCWVYRDNRYLWRNGFWTPNRADWIWTSDSYLWTPGGYVFVDGYWDYSFRNRGLLFAPVNINPRFWNRSDWSYRPHYVVHDNFLLSSLFVRPDHYYFGDYYDQRYTGLGFVPWIDHRYGRIADPTLSYYQWQNRDNPNWSRDLRGLYTARRDNAAIRPPQTLVQQTLAIQNITNKTTTVNNFTNITNLTALAPLAKVDHVKLQPVTRAQQANVKQTTSQFRDLSTQRGKQEAQTGNRIQFASQPGESPRAVKVPLPTNRPAPVKHPEGAKAPPARPVTPNPEPRPVIERAATPQPPKPPSHAAPVERLEPSLAPKPPAAHPQPPMPASHAAPVERLEPRQAPKPPAAHPQPPPKPPATQSKPPENRHKY
jgi:WXXGXW repeat (2 copies)